MELHEGKRAPRLSQAEQRLVRKLEVESHKIEAIATVEQPEVRRKMIEVAPERKREEMRKIAKVVRKAPESPVVKAIFKPKSKVTGAVAEKILELPEAKQESAIRQVEQLRLEEDEAVEHVESMKMAVPLPPKEEIASVKARY